MDSRMTPEIDLYSAFAKALRFSYIFPGRFTRILLVIKLIASHSLGISKVYHTDISSSRESFFQSARTFSLGSIPGRSRRRQSLGDSRITAEMLAAIPVRAASSRSED